jgi:micrococcal nuclease
MYNPTEFNPFTSSNSVLNMALTCQLYLSILSIVWLIALPADAFSGLVTGITDGDTITVLDNGNSEKIRLAGIDCPEKKQAFGVKAKQYTSSLCLQKQVIVIVLGHDRYRRTIADITLPNGRNLNAELVKAGYAWWYRKYAQDNKQLEQLEANAHVHKLGLWHDTAPIAPWNFRSAKSLRTTNSLSGTYE